MNSKSYSSISVLALLLVSSVLFAGCFEDNTQEFASEPRVEFKPINNFGVPNHEGEIEATALSGSGRHEVLVQLIGPQREGDLTVNYTINDTLTTANQGEDFTVEGNGSIVIPADSSSARLGLTINDFLDPNTNQRAQIGITLEGNPEEGVGAAANYRTFVVEVLAP